ncbi:2-succinyl-6-hydroxy-2,4-cyclohexadiene-1-carboxylate synthase [Vibrio sp. TH_r3]|uniref:2-succinyl-6-hydroxy-2, 4-cyclohexadiene-1-carboxylate synthase n=1 Tax=Vibrio sp. TH_r3 TaxID=3082084 RepID=UPI002955694F|nr:2-succinyl-6-hydroxy-2,4-cyclohexadiene-1-carboxylate synthase [Vibrio sp. TH_r3]MDV7103998.1 2-succinyl-6-hydroxy-2,4-cyclohexadiene-1-carboxylate synthase [Vibrio sp. TH_r3]
MLFVKQYAARTEQEQKPILVFVHGLLGDGTDWQELIDCLTNYTCFTVDLPGHGQSKVVKPIDFAHCGQLIRQAIMSVERALHDQPERPIVLVGYSLGARLVMFALVHGFLRDLNISACFIEGGHFGLTDQKEKQQRLANDTNWACRFRQQPIEQVLTDWYQQSVFASLNKQQTDELIDKRAHNQGSAIAEMLMATSLAKQPFLLDQLATNTGFIHYICGEKDEKFFSLAKQSELSFTAIEGAGHNVHKERPDKLAQLIKAKLEQCSLRF